MHAQWTEVTQGVVLPYAAGHRSRSQSNHVTHIHVHLHTHTHRPVSGDLFPVTRFKTSCSTAHFKIQDIVFDSTLQDSRHRVGQHLQDSRHRVRQHLQDSRHRVRQHT